MLSVFPAHAPADAQVAAELSAFLEVGCDAVCCTTDGALKPGQDLISAAETGLSADVLMLLVSPASNPPRWARDRWEPVLFRRASEAGTRVAVLLLEECDFPPLLRRGSGFFDATTDRLAALRRLKRWLRGVHFGGTYPAMAFSPELEVLYRSVADQPGSLTASAVMAERFAQEAATDFEAVFRIPAHGRSLARVAGELGSQLRMSLTGPPEDNCRRIRDLLCGKRCLLVLDAQPAEVDMLLPSGRTSVLFINGPVGREDDAPSLAGGRSLVSAGRFAEAYEVFYEMLNSGVEVESCARELAWICDQWDRVDEANNLRFHFKGSSGEQLRLF